MARTVGYLTKRFPRLSETFILDEILGLEAAGVPLRLYAIAHPGEALSQPDVARVASPVTYLTGASGWRQTARDRASMLRAHATLLRRWPRRYLALVAHILRKRRHLSTFRHFAEAGLLAVLLERDDARHLHAAFAHGPATVAHFVHLLTGMPYSFAGHAKDIYVSAPDILAIKTADAAFVLACSRSAASTLRAVAGPAADKVVLAPHGVDTRRFAPTGDRGTRPATDACVRVLAVGRLTQKKGYPVLLDALSILASRGTAVSCEIFGAGPDKEELHSQAHRLGIAQSVRFRGARTHQEIAAAYAGADVFVQASVVLANGDRDGIPNSLLEAMSSGLPVVASSVAGIPEVVVPGCGILVPPGDPAALAGAIGALVADGALRARLGDSARRYVLAHLDRAQCARAIAPLFAPSTREATPATPATPATREAAREQALVAGPPGG